MVENEVQGVDFNNNKIEDYKEKVEVEKNDNNQISNNNEPNNIEVNIADESTDDELTIEEEKEVEEGDLDYAQVKNSKYFQYKLPLLEFLDDPIEIVEHNQDELTEKGKQLKYALNTYSVDGEVVKVSPGPVISLFEVVPAEGVRVNKFVNLSDDLARVMKAQRVRIIAPIPGSRSVGIELPNEKTSIVYLKSILNSQKYISSTSKLTIALGKTTTGDAYVFDLCKMPHLLVAGATGSGKSVCINTIIISILYKAKPDEVKFILMDPKKLELSTYKSLVGYHLITAPNLDEYVMTTAENSLSILNSAISEMERRFQVFSDARVRNIDEYHTKQKNNNDLEKIPYIVVLIDELADLMMTSGRAVEEPITRLAQKARAVGIHLVLATQRPSVDVITGLIKSNFPSRISFQVSSKVDSRTILDQMGAEKLLGKGDMLFLLPGSASPIRLHNAYITLDEIEKIMDHISAQPKPDEIKLPEVVKAQSDSSFNISEDQDELLQDAAKLVVSNQQASVSLLQRKFKIGYSRAGRLIDELEALGIVSSYNGSKAREVLVEYSYLEEVFGSNE
ncbi:MAG: cell division protein FtsK [Candidatus Marinimicrobia bacterium]|nr:cell division protein FtsK [Candidatus Neomarinimicrobiota bacterium]